MCDLNIPEKLAEVPGELSRLFCLRGGVAETSKHFGRSSSSQPERLWFILQQMFFLLSDLCPGDSNLENEGVAAHDYATYTYLIEVISFVIETANRAWVLSGSCCSPWALHLGSRELLFIFVCKEHNQSDFYIDHLVVSMDRVNS